MKVTVDTGGPDDLFVGALLTWMHKPRGGYGYSIPIAAKVVSHARRPRSWVKIEVQRRDGRMVHRTVDAISLRWR